MNRSELRAVTEAELLAVEGGGILSWLKEAAAAVASVLRCINKTCA
jgi:hypothetical protein